MIDKITAFLDSEKKAQLNLLERLVVQTSHSLDKKGVDRVGEIIRDALSSCALSLSIDQQQNHGDNLLFRSPACLKNELHILLVGHMDTVFTQQDTFKSYREDRYNAYGPGIIDMKGGLVVAIYLLKALHSQGLLEKIPIALICNSDEEIGSPQSTPLIQEKGKNGLCGLVFECGGLNGEVVTGRKGKVGYQLEVFGQTGHAAFTKKNGKASAIVELAHKILKLESLNNPEKEIVVNVGEVTGGTGANVVAGHASALIDTRFVSEEDGKLLRKNIATITAENSVANTHASISTINSRFPMNPSEKNRRLFQIIKSQAHHLALSVSSELRSGVSDANTLAQLGIPVIDGLGPIGDHDHSENEYMIKDSLNQRTKLATFSVLEIWKNYANSLA